MRAVTSLALVSLALAALTACGGVKEDTWSKKGAKATCDFSKKCATANFYATYDDMGACIDENELALDNEAAQKSGEGCTFDDDQAKECLKALGTGCKTAGEEAETLFDPCLRVWNCGASPVDTGA